jgi:hypothetical protein
MDWNTLVVAVAGGLLAVIPVLITIRNQSIERDKDRQEQRRDARIQAREKWTERDILKMMDSIEKILKLVGGAVNVDTCLKPTDEELSAINKEFMQTADTIAQLVNSFADDDIYSGYRDFTAAIYAFFQEVSETPEYDIEKRSHSDKWMAVKKRAGYFHWALREKMISMQNSETL